MERKGSNIEYIRSLKHRHKKLNQEIEKRGNAERKEEGRERENTKTIPMGLKKLRHTITLGRSQQFP